MVRKLTPNQMVSPKAIAPFEAAEAFKLWNERLVADASRMGIAQAGVDDWGVIHREACEGLGPPWPMFGERPSDFGERCAVALFTLIKEI